ncbi:LuxR C-terminal-related transcriptional regulator [Janibacter sp. Soil728]|uniref:LuxR C-terminal-related transcriptional regulator n=1 Tax=Janibacter sp. Soil728 TaxID=1736393 RepID=UPI0012E845C2|nr:LuxR C-terminal-related transcriptional regulator [Janibacter sp. Soil728]
MSGQGMEPYLAVIDLITRVADAPAHVDQRLETMSELLIEMTVSVTGLMVHGAPDGYEVRALGRGVSAAAQQRMSQELRITAGPDPFLDAFRAGDLTPTTAGRAYGGQQIWQVSAKCLGSIDIWGIDQVAGLPVRGGEQFVAFLVGRRGADYTDADLDRLRAVQPAVAGLVSMLEPHDLPPRSIRVAQLTTRELQVLRLLADGHKATAIGHRAGCSQRTVHRHLSNIYGKLDVSDRLSAVVRAQETGLLEHGPSLPRHG